MIFPFAFAEESYHVEVKEGNRMLAILDSLLAPALASRPDLAAEWRSARRALVREGAGRGEDAEMKVVSSAPSPVGTEVATAA